MLTDCLMDITQQDTDQVLANMANVSNRIEHYVKVVFKS